MSLLVYAVKQTGATVIFSLSCRLSHFFFCIFIYSSVTLINVSMILIVIKEGITTQVFFHCIVSLNQE